MEYPMVCVSVKQAYEQNRLKLDLINMNSGASWFHSDELEDIDGTGLFKCVICIQLRYFYHGINLIWTLFYFWHVISYMCQEDKLSVLERRVQRKVFWPMYEQIPYLPTCSLQIVSLQIVLEISFCCRQVFISLKYCTYSRATLFTTFKVWVHCLFVLSVFQFEQSEMFDSEIF